jgi:ABC-type phosphate transport system substrate-binding protein
MKLLALTTWIALLALLAAAASAPARAATALELAVVVHASTRVASMSAVEMETMFTRSQTRWDDGTPIVPINTSPGSESRILFDKAVLRLDPDAVGRFWIDRRIRGFGLPPRHVAEPGTIVRVVQKLAGTISYVPEPLAREAGLKVVARIRHGKVLPP